MKQESKEQLQALLAVLSKRHPAVCDALSQAARSSLPTQHASALVQIITCDVAGTVNTAAVATVAALVDEVAAVEVTP